MPETKITFSDNDADKMAETGSKVLVPEDSGGSSRNRVYHSKYHCKFIRSWLGSYTYGAERHERVGSLRTSADLAG